MSTSEKRPAGPVLSEGDSPSSEVVPTSSAVVEATGDGAPASGGSVPRRRGPRRAVRRGTEREAVLGVSADERPSAWGEGSDGAPGSNDGGGGSNDEQLRRDVPPHWG